MPMKGNDTSFEVKYVGKFLLLYNHFLIQQNTVWHEQKFM